MQAPEPQSAENEILDPSTTESGVAPDLEVLTGYLADADSDDEVELRESPGGESGGWLVIRRRDIVDQTSGDGHDLLPGESEIQVRHDAIVVFRAKVEVFRVGAVAREAQREPRDGPDRWPRRG